MLLGVDGISIIAHGRSSALAITNAVKVAWDRSTTICRQDRRSWPAARAPGFPPPSGGDHDRIKHRFP